MSDDEAPKLDQVLQLGGRGYGLRIENAKVLPYEPRWNLDYRLTNWLMEGPWGKAFGTDVARGFGVGASFLIDTTRFTMRLPWSVLGKMVGGLERWWWSKRWYCPFCFTPHRELYIHCPDCQRVQAALWPALGEMWKRRCPGRCKAFGLVGNYVSRPAAPLICRDSPEFSGCHRPLPTDVPWGKHRELHVAICGPTRWQKLAVLALLWQGLIEGTGRWGAEPCGELTTNEHEYLQATCLEEPRKLSEAMKDFTYTLARSGTFLGGRGRRQNRLIQFHNIIGPWMLSDERLFKRGLHLLHDDALVFVADLNHPDLKNLGLLPNAAHYSRLLRCIEQISWEDSAHRTFRGRVAVVVPQVGRVSSKRSAAAEVRERDPHFWGLLQQTVGNRAAFFSGPLTSYELPDEWVGEVLDFALGR